MVPIFYVAGPTLENCGLLGYEAVCFCFGSNLLHPHIHTSRNHCIYHRRNLNLMLYGFEDGAKLPNIISQPHTPSKSTIYYKLCSDSCYGMCRILNNTPINVVYSLQSISNRLTNEGSRVEGLGCVYHTEVPLSGCF